MATAVLASMFAATLHFDLPATEFTFEVGLLGPAEGTSFAQ